MAIEPDRLPTTAELHEQLRNGEDHTTERKSRNDTKDILKTMVAFANSMPIGYPGVLFIGVRNDGIFEGLSSDEIDKFQKRVRREAEGEAYPPIYYTTRIVEESPGGPQCLAVIVPGSKERPHFAGLSYVRKGSESPKASEEQFQALIAERSSKVYELRRWVGKPVSCATINSGFTSGWNTGASVGIAIKDVGICTIENCGVSFATLRHQCTEAGGEHLGSVPLSAVEVSFDDDNGRLRLILGEEHWTYIHAAMRKKSTKSPEGV